MQIEVNRHSRFSWKGEQSQDLWWLNDVKQIEDVDTFIAKGGQGAVFKATYKPANKGKVATHEQFQTIRVALKITVINMMTAENADNALKNAQREIQNTRLIMMKKFTNVVEFYAAEDSLVNDIYRSYIIMEMASADLFGLINKSIYMRADLCYQACRGLHNLHSINLFHRDIKPENFLVKKRKGHLEHYDAKLSDMGCSRLLDDKQNIYSIKSQTIVGTPFYLAPEVKMQDEQNKNFRAQDIYSFCMALLMMLFGLEENNITKQIFDDPIRNRERRSLRKQDFLKGSGGVSSITIPNLENANKLLECIFKGLKYDSGERMPDLSQLLAQLKVYEGYQEKKCRFSHDKYYEEVMCLSDNLAIENIDALVWDNGLMNEPMPNQIQFFGSCVIKATVLTNNISKKCVLRLSKARTAFERQQLWRYIQQCKQLKQIYDDRLVKIYDTPKIYSFTRQAGGIVKNEIKQQSKIIEGDCLLGFVFMEAGTMDLVFHYLGRLEQLEKMGLHEDKQIPEQFKLIAELRTLRGEKNELSFFLKEMSLKNRFHLCFKVLEILAFCHSKQIAIGAISTQNVMLFPNDTTYRPKVVKLDNFVSQCKPEQKRHDIIHFYYFYKEMVFDVLKFPKIAYRVEDDETEENRLRQKASEMENYIKYWLNSPALPANFMDIIMKQFSNYARYEPNTYANSPLEWCTEAYPELRKRIKQATPLSGHKSPDWSVLYEHNGTIRETHIDVYTLSELTDFERASIENAIRIINLIKDSKYMGFLQYYEANFDPKKPYAYIISEDYRCRCDDIQSLKKRNEIQPNGLISDFKEILISLNHIHRLKISHMDILPKNFYLVGKTHITIKLGGFGFAMTADNSPQYFQVTRVMPAEMRFKPPEYFLRSYPVAARFASDIWMLCSSLLIFSLGLKQLPTVMDLSMYNYNKQLPTIQQLYDEANRVSKLPSQSVVRNDSIVAQHVITIRNYLYRADWNDRAGPKFIDEFLTRLLNYRTVVPGVTGNATQSYAKTIAYMQDITEVMEKLSSGLEYFLVSEEQHLKGFVSLLTVNDESFSNREFEDIGNVFRSINSIHYMKYVNSWLYILTYLEVFCMKSALGAIEQAQKTDNRFSDPKRRLKERLENAGVRLNKYHSYLEKFEPDLPRLSRTLDQKSIFSKFKERLFLLFLLFRRYVIEAKDSFTEDDTVVLQLVHMTFTVQDYLRLYMEQKIGLVTKHSDLMEMPFDQLIQRIAIMLKTQSSKLEKSVPRPSH